MILNYEKTAIDIHGNSHVFNVGDHIKCIYTYGTPEENFIKEIYRSDATFKNSRIIVVYESGGYDLIDNFNYRIME